MAKMGLQDLPAGPKQKKPTQSGGMWSEIL
jgi:hypothetical protein